MRRRTRRWKETRGGQGGFTLIEILVVIGLISLLMVFLMPMLTAGQDAAKINQCQLTIQSAVSAADEYMGQRRFGDYPPDDFRDPLKTFKVPADSVNPGIESFLAFIHRPDSRAQGFGDKDEWFCNTDRDKADAPIGKLDRVEKVELKDPWDNPMAYFHHRHYGEEQTYRMGGDPDVPEGEEQTVQAWRTKDGRWLNARTFQLFSAGPDGVFNTSDDIGNFTIPDQEND